MRTQSRDTHPDTERMLIELIRAASYQKRFSLVQSLSKGLVWTKLRGEGVREQTAAVAYVTSRYGSRLAACVQEALVQRDDWHIHSTNLLDVLLPALQTFAQFGISAYLGGSLASSLHGMQQAAADVDLIVDLLEQAPLRLLPALREWYILDESAVAQALQQRESFSLLHLDMLKEVHIIIPHLGSFDRAMQRLVRPSILDEKYPPIPLASAVEMVFCKLLRYHQYTLTARHGMEDDATWNDVLGVLKVQAPTLEYPLLDHWARELGILDLLTQALIDAGSLSERPPQHIKHEKGMYGLSI